MAQNKTDFLAAQIASCMVLWMLLQSCFWYTSLTLYAVVQSADSPGVFCQFEDVIDAAGCDILQKVVPIEQLACLCDEKIVDGQAYYRLNDTKVLDVNKMSSNQGLHRTRSQYFVFSRL